MCKPQASRVDDAPSEPVGQEGKVQATTDVSTLQRWLTAAVERLRKARKQRDDARAQAMAECKLIVLSLANALKHSERINRESGKAVLDVNTAIYDAEQLLKLTHSYGSHSERIVKIAQVARQALHTAMIAQSHQPTRLLRGTNGDDLWYVEHAITPLMLDAQRGDLLEGVIRGLTYRFEAEGHTARTIVVRMQSW